MKIKQWKVLILSAMLALCCSADLFATGKPVEYRADIVIEDNVMVRVAVVIEDDVIGFTITDNIIGRTTGTIIDNIIGRSDIVIEDNVMVRLLSAGGGVIRVYGCHDERNQELIQNALRGVEVSFE